MKNVKRLLSLILVLVMCAGLLSTFASAAASAMPVCGDTYYIVSALNENKAIDVSGGSSRSGANIQLYDFNGTGAQLFTVTCKGGYYTFVNKNSGKVIDVQGGGKTSGTNVQQYASNNTDAQKWRIIDLGNGYCSIQAKCGLYLDVQGANTSNGTNIQIYTGNGTKAQMFKFVPYVKYTYKTVKLDCSSLEAWKKSMTAHGRSSLNGCIVAQNVRSYKTVSMKVADYGPHGTRISGYKTIQFKLPYEVEFKMHTHTLNKGYGRSWYYTNGGLQAVETCNCGYRKEGAFWKIPKPTDKSVQTTQSVVSQLPQF